MTQLYSESRYEAEIVAPSEVVDCWTANVWMGTKASRRLLASFVDVCETAASDAAWRFMAERPR